MSGGSYDYVSRDMEDGEINGFSRQADRMIADLTRYRVEAEGLSELVTYTAERGEDGKYKSIEHRTPRDARHLLAFDVAIGQMAAARALVVKAQDAMRQLALVAHEVEWCASGDTGVESLTEALTTWMMKQLGVVP